MNKRVFFLFTTFVLLLILTIEIIYLKSKPSPKTQLRAFAQQTTIGDFAFFNDTLEDRFFTITPKSSPYDPSLEYNSYGGFVYHDQ